MEREDKYPEDKTEAHEKSFVMSISPVNLEWANRSKANRNMPRMLAILSASTMLPKGLTLKLKMCSGIRLTSIDPGLPSPSAPNAQPEHPLI